MFVLDNIKWYKLNYKTLDNFFYNKMKYVFFFLRVENVSHNVTYSANYYKSSPQL